MNKTIKIRDAVRNFVIPNSKWLTKIGKGLLAFVSFMIINHYFGYITFLDNPVIALVLAIGCAIIPLRAGGLLVMIYVFFQLTGLSGQVAALALLLMLASYGLSIFYGSKHMFNIDYIPVALQIQMPYPIVAISALFGRMADVTSVICGGILAFYLKIVRENASLFIEDSGVSIIDVISKRMIINPMFYIYIIAIVALFVIIVVVKNSKLKHAWIIAISVGIFTEMVLMMLGYIMTGNISRVPMLIVSNVVAFIMGVAVNYLFRDLDYDRVENVQFEDDDYIYYVTAVPKIELAREEKRITRITAGGKFHNAGRVANDDEEDKSESD